MEAIIKKYKIENRKGSSPKSRGALSKTAIHTLLGLWSLLTIFPMLWVLNNSFKDRTIILKDSFSLTNASTFTFENYITAFSRMNIARAYLNSFIISSTVVIGVMCFGGLAAYILARYKFRGRNFIYGALISAVLFPAFATIVPVFMGLYQLDLVNKHLGVILPQIAGNLPFAIIIMVGFMESIPLELEEAAVVEGSGPFQIFTKIVVPISKPSFATVAIFTFLWSYNDLFMQMIIIRKNEYLPVSALLNKISSEYGTDYGLMNAAVTLVVIPVFIVYLFLQKHIIKGLTAGAVKG
ncbi:carbohydrate ABC transporter permease [Cellulosilyticum sp. I15G10I2]|uniref:carbohydrate ABC transporter permease n=1 Tax=Cellulosilyticum sp. I15G10I2 TaxID=1892843 RepID=UPI00085C50D5|nr:carbohydrate ABC transporter permease [Cellulosilyticum sp. I15G10I2]